jgi:hypothetical protein
MNANTIWTHILIKKSGNWVTQQLTGK